MQPLRKEVIRAKAFDFVGQVVWRLELLKKTLLGLVIAVGLLTWLILRLDVHQLQQHLLAANLFLLLAMQLTKAGVTGVKAWRWGVAIRSALPDAQPTRLFSSTMIGLLGNMLFPARLGELLRVQLLHKNNPEISRSLALTSALVPQILDLLVVLVLLGTGMTLSLRSSTNPDLHTLSRMSLLLLVVVVLILVGLWIFYKQFERLAPLGHRALGVLPDNIAVRLQSMASEIHTGLSFLVKGHSLLRVFGLTLLLWTLETTALVLAMWAFGLKVSPGMVLTLVGILSLTFVLPVTPGGMGVHQWAATFILGFFAVSAEKAAGLSVAIQGIDLLTVFCLGSLFLYFFEGLSFSKLKEEGEKLQEDAAAGEE